MSPDIRPLMGSESRPHGLWLCGRPYRPVDGVRKQASARNIHTARHRTPHIGAACRRKSAPWMGRPCDPKGEGDVWLVPDVITFQDPLHWICVPPKSSDVLWHAAGCESFSLVDRSPHIGVVCRRQIPGVAEAASGAESPR